jgi:hypothetical protein
VFSIRNFVFPTWLFVFPTQNYGFPNRIYVFLTQNFVFSNQSFGIWNVHFVLLTKTFGSLTIKSKISSVEWSSDAINQKTGNSGNSVYHGSKEHIFGCTDSNSRILVFFIISMMVPIDRVPSCLIFGNWGFGRNREKTTCEADHGNITLISRKDLSNKPFFWGKGTQVMHEMAFFVVRFLVMARFPDF